MSVNEDKHRPLRLTHIQPAIDYFSKQKYQQASHKCTTN